MLALHHVLVINPNTTEAVTQALLMKLSAGLPQVQWHGQTAAFGAPYIADEYSYCVAGHAVLDAWEHATALAPAGGFDAVVVGCFGDPGLQAMQEVANTPVYGLAQAAVWGMAAQGHQRMAIVTGGEKWKPMLERWSRANGYAPGTAAGAGSEGAQVVQISTVAANGMDLMRAPQVAAQALAVSCQQSLSSSGAQAVLLGGAGLAGMGERVRALTGLPVWDCVEALQWWLQRHLLSAPRRLALRRQA